MDFLTMHLDKYKINGQFVVFNYYSPVLIKNNKSSSCYCHIQCGILHIKVEFST